MISEHQSSALVCNSDLVSSATCWLKGRIAGMMTLPGCDALSAGFKCSSYILVSTLLERISGDLGKSRTSVTKLPALTEKSNVFCNSVIAFVL